MREMRNKITMNHYFTPVRMVKFFKLGGKKKKPGMPCTNEDAEELKISYIADGNVKYETDTLERNLSVPNKINILTI